ncbi:methionyl-tRNA formyltransferase [Spongiibacter sp. IMCC21906]|uniref:methionyl-tRNA formyltransferase n=1 Tax=Spongiibacter sp. IMCC21906 TaxID=1620392 RepID=UPI00062DF2B1|nr:methionyl-tRNA formyltransferase [Spongiibacter sp. IMCC21906]AKH68136.1 methionyl-tRNA formyltransferase [Spongiibacter sp. IMCC21906]
MDTPRLRLVFAGTPDFAAAHLQALLDNGQHDIVGVYSQPDRPAGRGKKPKPSPVKQLAERAELPVFQPINFKEDSARQELAGLRADLMIVVAYGLILPQAVLDIPRFGCVNVHGSILPRWRGAAPIQRAIEAGDRETGVTIMQMDAGLDTGDMLRIAKCEITSTTTSAELHDTLAKLGGPALIDAINSLATGTAIAQAQNDDDSNYAAKIDKIEAEIDWSQSSATLDRKIRAFNPFPCCYTNLAETRIKIWQAQPVADADADGEAGTILQADKQGITVACGSGALRLLAIQLPGARAMSAAEILNSKAQLFAPGTQLGRA